MMGGVDAPAMDTEHEDEATFMSELLPDIPEKNQVVVQWSNVHAWVGMPAGGLPFSKMTMKRENLRQILTDVEGEAQPGELVALMGPSGCGKTTLLRILSGRAKAIPIVDGSVTYNGSPLTKLMKRKIGMVTQDDVMFDSLTVIETLSYTARLKLPSYMSKADREKRVKGVIDKLGLTLVTDTIVGSNLGSPSGLRGLSGGERKRVSIAIEILTNPAVLYLDEPTSGLDATIAMNLVRNLRDLARGGRAIITSIHQPASRVYALMDRVMLMGRGSMIYSGPALGAADYFAELGHTMEFGVNVADFLLDLVNGEEGASVDDLIAAYQKSKDDGGNYESTYEHYVDAEDSLAEANDVENPPSSKATSVDAPPQLGEKHGNLARSLRLPWYRPEQYFAAEEKWPTSWLQQYFILTQRSMRQRRFEIWDLWTMVQFALTTALTGIFWFQAGQQSPNDPEVILDIVSLLFFQLTFMTFASLFAALFTFPSEKRIMMKERAAGMYRLSAYYAAKSTADLPLILLYPFLFICVIYWMTGLRQSASFLLNLSVNMGVVLIAQSVGLAIGASILNMKKAQVLAAIFTLLMMVTAGFLVRDIPIWIDWVKYLSFIRYAYQVLIKIEFVGTNYDCTDPPLGETYCSISEAKTLLQTDPNTTAYPQSLALVGFFLFYRLLGYLALLYSTSRG